MAVFLVYLYLVVFIIFDIVILTLGIEQMVGFYKNMAPEVPASKKLRQGVAAQIKKDMVDVKSILDIGSGWGTMVKTVARAFPKASVTGIEIMPLPFVYSSIRCLLNKNVKIVLGNAFKVLKKKNEKFDVAIAYLLTPEMKNVEGFLSGFKILIAVDFPLPDVKESEKIKLHKDRFGQHYLYVYKK
ncbi:MAG: class I SAM-dependent methyltransferase [Rickettsiales bacterium]|jgi:hypothetical protein|nr:class I SAM-dependent methyltransferase [Rickettsiales bacterium]